MYVLYAIALGIITAHSTSHRPQSERGEHCAGDHEARAIPTDHIVLIKRLQTTDPVARVNIHRLRNSDETLTEHVARITGTDYITLENAHAARTHIHRV